jgi:dihydropteroate synthase
MIIGKKEFNTDDKTYVMGILNVTPDSFSDGGKWNEIDASLKHVETMLLEGADIIDIGGESTRPGYTKISDEEEIARVVPVIEAVKERFDIPVSLDTYKSQVARAGIAAGVDLINDIWGLKYDEDLARVIAESKVACCLMHNRDQAEYDLFFKDVLRDLEESISIARNAGIQKNQIILDPGVGFGKTYEQNLEVIRRVGEIGKLGYPVLLGTSRKSVIGLSLDVPVTERVEGTIATTVMGVERGVSFVRVHDVQANKRAIQMTEAILGR